MPKIPKPSRCAKQKTNTPTGLRRFFFKLELLGKRTRDSSSFQQGSSGSADATTISSRLRSHSANGKENVAPKLPVPGQNLRFPSRVALQNEDTAEDAVIITALDKIPFCCHEDLVTMSREQLIKVAVSLNAKLPAAMAIDVSHIRPTSFIRSSIELIVGIRGDVPQAPKPVRSRSEHNVYLLDSAFDWNVSPPPSPLAKRGKKDLHMSLISPRLERLEEVEEVDSVREDANRGAKRRKILAELVSPMQVDYAEVDIGVEPKIETPTPVSRILRTQSHRIVSCQASPTTGNNPHRVLRSQSQKLEKPMMAGIDTAFVNTKRRYKNKGKDMNDYDGPRKAGRLRPVSGHGATGVPSSDRYRPVTSHSLPQSSVIEDEDTFGPSVAVVGAKRKRSLGRIEAERQMVVGLREMSMGSTNARHMDTR